MNGSLNYPATVYTSCELLLICLFNTKITSEAWPTHVHDIHRLLAHYPTHQRREPHRYFMIALLT